MLSKDFMSLTDHEKAIVGSRQLEIYTHQISHLADNFKDFGGEIYGYMQDWDDD